MVQALVQQAPDPPVAADYALRQAAMSGDMGQARALYLRALEETSPPAVGQGCFWR